MLFFDNLDEHPYRCVYSTQFSLEWVPYTICTEVPITQEEECALYHRRVCAGDFSSYLNPKGHLVTICFYSIESGEQLFTLYANGDGVPGVYFISGCEAAFFDFDGNEIPSVMIEHIGGLTDRHKVNSVPDSSIVVNTCLVEGVEEEVSAPVMTEDDEVCSSIVADCLSAEVAAVVTTDPHLAEKEVSVSVMTEVCSPKVCAPIGESPMAKSIREALAGQLVFGKPSFSAVTAILVITKVLMILSQHPRNNYGWHIADHFGKAPNTCHEFLPLIVSQHGPTSDLGRLFWGEGPTPADQAGLSKMVTYHVDPKYPQLFRIALKDEYLAAHQAPPEEKKGGHGKGRGGGRGGRGKGHVKGDGGASGGRGRGGRR